MPYIAIASRACSVLTSCVKLALLIHLFLAVTITAEPLCGGVKNKYVCDDFDPQVFHICIGDSKHTLVCPGVLNFNARTQTCDWPTATNCLLNAQQPPQEVDFVQNPDAGLSYEVQTPPPLATEGYVTSRNYQWTTPQQHGYWSTGSRYPYNVQDSPFSQADVAFQNEAGNKIFRKEPTFRNDIENKHEAEVYKAKAVDRSPWMSNENIPKEDYSSYDKYRSSYDDAGNSKSARRVVSKQRRRSYAKNRSPVAAMRNPYRPWQSSRTLPRPTTRYTPRFTSMPTINERTTTTTPPSSRPWRSIYSRTTARFYERPTQPGERNPSPTVKIAPTSSYISQRVHRSDFARNRNSFQKGRRKKNRPMFSNVKHEKNPANFQKSGTPAWVTHMSERPHSRKSPPTTADPRKFIRNRFSRQDGQGQALYQHNENMIGLASSRGQSPGQISSFKSEMAAPNPYRNSLIPREDDLSRPTNDNEQNYNDNRYQAIPRPPAPEPWWSMSINKNQNKQENQQNQFNSYSGKADSKYKAPSPPQRNTPPKGASSSLYSSVPQGRVQRPQQTSVNQAVRSPEPINAAAALEPRFHAPIKHILSQSKVDIRKYQPKSGRCDSSWCKLPDCRCIGTDIPGGLNVKDIPQMVMLTFDDSVNEVNFDYYRAIFNRTLVNPNGCRIKGTFFVSGESTNYNMVRELHKQGHEIASHTLSHRNPTTWWAKAGYDNWKQEVVGMRDNTHHKAGVPVSDINGMRAPFLQVGGDDQYSMLKDSKFRYDSSMVTGHLYKNTRPPIWPFTLDSAPDSTTCSLTPCPKRSYPGLWEVPLVRWYGTNNVACAMPDACETGSGAQGGYKFVEENFNRHYHTNKAPLGIFIHASWFKRKYGTLEGLVNFLWSLQSRGDVWMVSVNQALDWMQSPTKLSELGKLKSWNC